LEQQTTTTQNDIGSLCVTSQQNELGILSWYKVSLNGVVLYMTVVPVALVDNTPKNISVTLNQNQEVVFQSAAFFDQLVVDPNYSVLLEDATQQQQQTQCNNYNLLLNNNNNNNKISITNIIVIVVCVVVVVVFVGVFVFVFVPKIKVWYAIHKYGPDNDQEPDCEMQTNAAADNPTFKSPFKRSKLYDERPVMQKKYKKYN